MLDAVADRIPVLVRDLRADWLRVRSEVYDDLVAVGPRPPLRSHGATNLREVFAVPTELRFEQAKGLQGLEPAL